MKKVISMFLSMVLMVTSLNTYCAACEPDSSELDVNSIVNADFIKEYGSYVGDNDKMNNFMKIMSQKNRKLVNITVEEIAKGNIKLDENMSSTAKLTEAFLKKIYDKDNIDYFKKALKKELSDCKMSTISFLKDKENGEVEINKFCENFFKDEDDYLGLWYFKCPLIMGMVNTDIMTYLVHTDPESKEIIERIKGIETKVRTGIELYIDSMNLTEDTKQSMKKTLNEVEVYYYGVNKNFDRYFEDINREELLKNIKSDNETFFSSLYIYLPEAEYNEEIDSAIASVIFNNVKIYEPNACASFEKNYIVFFPTMFLCKDINISNSDFNLEFLIRVVLSHEFGHAWNAKYIKKHHESVGVVCPRDNKQEFEKYLKEWHPAKEVCSEDMQKLETYAQSIVDEFNSVKTNLQDDEGKEIKIDGLRVYKEAAADNFALNSVIAFAKKENEDLSKMFFTSARFFWGTYNMQSFKGDIYPPAPYRVNIGLKLCKKNMATNKIALDSTPVVTLPAKLENGENEFLNTEGMGVMAKNSSAFEKQAENSNDGNSSSLEESKSDTSADNDVLIPKNSIRGSSIFDTGDNSLSFVLGLIVTLSMCVMIILGLRKRNK